MSQAPRGSAQGTVTWVGAVPPYRVGVLRAQSTSLTSEQLTSPQEHAMALRNFPDPCPVQDWASPVWGGLSVAAPPICPLVGSPSDPLGERPAQ